MLYPVQKINVTEIIHVLRDENNCQNSKSVRNIYQTI